MQPSRDISRLIEIMARLRDKETGCPWDVEQDFRSIRHYTIEEAYEVADAIEREDYEDLRDELGDLLLQPIYHAQMAKEEGLFEIGDVIYAVTEKLIRRHPHVFGDDEAGNAASSENRWEAIKAGERAKKAERRGGEKPPSLLDDVPAGLPALTRAGKLAKRAARVGFDWPEVGRVLDKLVEEAHEIAAARATASQAEIEEEIGDFLFASANLARHLDVDPEAALRAANAKFTRRFARIEARLAERGKRPEDSDLAEMDALWDAAKAEEKAGAAAKD